MELMYTLWFLQFLAVLLPSVSSLKCYDCIGAQESDRDKCLTSKPNLSVLKDAHGDSVMCLDVFITINYKGIRTVILRTPKNVTQDLNGKCTEGFPEYYIYPNITKIVGCYCNKDGCNISQSPNSQAQLRASILVNFSIAVLIYAWNLLSGSDLLERSA